MIWYGDQSLPDYTECPECGAQLEHHWDEYGTYHVPTYSKFVESVFCRDCMFYEEWIV